jgi:hypothetical protein
MQLTQRALEQIQNRPNLPASALAALQAYQQESIQQAMRVQKAVEEWSHSVEEGQTGAGATAGGGRKDRSPWGISGRKPVFEVLWRLASGSSLLRAAGEEKGSYSVELLHDASKVHPVVIEASQKNEEARLFLIE